MADSVRIFIDYCHRHEAWKDRLVRQPAVLATEGLSIWDDRRIAVGTGWEDTIERAITERDLVLLLVSAPFFTSSFLLGQEVPKLLQRPQNQGTQVIPPIASACQWTRVPWLRAIQARPKAGDPLSGLLEQDAEAALSAPLRTGRRGGGHAAAPAHHGERDPDAEGAQSPVSGCPGLGGEVRAPAPAGGDRIGPDPDASRWRSRSRRPMPSCASCGNPLSLLHPYRAPTWGGAMTGNRSVGPRFESLVRSSGSPAVGDEDLERAVQGSLLPTADAGSPVEVLGPAKADAPFVQALLGPLSPAVLDLADEVLLLASPAPSAYPSPAPAIAAWELSRRARGRPGLVRFVAAMLPAGDDARAPDRKRAGATLAHRAAAADRAPGTSPIPTSAKERSADRLDPRPSSFWQPATIEGSHSTCLDS